MYQTGMWRSLAARALWEREVGGSNPLIPTMKCQKCDHYGEIKSIDINGVPWVWYCKPCRLEFIDMLNEMAAEYNERDNESPSS